MANDAQRSKQGRGLGRGMATLLAQNKTAVEDPTPETRTPRKLPIAFLRPNPRNPRKTFREQDLAELAESIKAKGVIQPIIVRAVADERDAYEIIAGERRWRAAQMAGSHEAPVVVLKASDQEALEIALIENLQRTDLNALEEAGAYERLIAEFKYSNADLGAVIGKSRSHVSNTMRLLKLPEGVKEHVREGRLSAGHARALLTTPNPEAVAEKIIEEGLSVRDVEAMSQEQEKIKETKPKPQMSADVKALEKNLSDSLGLRVALRHKGKGGGEVRISYRTLEQLDDVCNRLRQFVMK